ncbi:PREDICTED: SLIT and NTRK-like protein 6 [Nicrophorus vespilloides]|uniref:SLIT and NTRK-like protein 6 n=1 Tax=Nicrophorus vespilloides TaxID=110193 RepID=A0ABM1N0F7_NICVS|nr:PREDICTED: SLIT and NTRK-like protein 6 [Nicrophorus vespilloides]
MNELSLVKVVCDQKYLVFRNVNDTVLPVGTFRMCLKTNILDLSNNKLEAIRAGAFLGLTSLTELYLSNNRIEEIEPGTFHTLSKLQTFTMTGNSIKTLPEYEFTSPKIKYFNLNNNNLDYLPSTALVNLKYITLLDLSMNGLAEMDPASLINVQPGATIILNNNKLSNISFRVNTTVIKPKVFSILKLSGNLIATLMRASLGQLYKLNLITLDLSFNQINFIQSGVFRDFGSIANLFISHNELDHLNENVFRDLKKLKLLDLSYNRITTQVFDLVLSDTIKYLNYSNNNIETLVDFKWVYHTAKKDIDLDVSANKLDYLDANRFSSKVRRVSLAHNNWKCSVLYNIIQILESRHIAVYEGDNYMVDNVNGIPCRSNHGKKFSYTNSRHEKARMTALNNASEIDDLISNGSGANNLSNILLVYIIAIIIVLV